MWTYPPQHPTNWNIVYRRPYVNYADFNSHFLQHNSLSVRCPSKWVSFECGAEMLLLVRLVVPSLLPPVHSHLASSSEPSWLP